MLTHNGKIAIPDRDPKEWRSRGRKKRKQPAVASAIVTPAPMKKRRGPVMRDEQQHNGQEQPRRSAIVEPRRKPRTTLIFGPAPRRLRPGGAPARWREGRRAVPRDRAPGCPQRVTDLPTERTHAPGGRLAGVFCLVQGVPPPGPADLKAIVDAGRGDVPLKEGSEVPVRQVRQPDDRSCDDGEGRAGSAASDGVTKGADALRCPSRASHPRHGIVSFVDSGRPGAFQLGRPSFPRLIGSKGRCGFGRRGEGSDKGRAPLRLAQEPDQYADSAPHHCTKSYAGSDAASCRKVITLQVRLQLWVPGSYRLLPHASTIPSAMASG
jgi:hypothetical protein